MQQQVRWLAILLAHAVALGGCGGTTEGTGSVAPASACLGDYSGSYAGNATGSIEAQLTESGRFQMTFSPKTGNLDFSGTGRLEEDGTLTFDSDLLMVTGSLNEATCRASGRWDVGSGRGTWNASKR